MQEFPIAGTYQCRWRWRGESHCIKAVDEEGERLAAEDVSTVHLLGHDAHRSATLYVKVYKLKSYFEVRDDDDQNLDLRVTFTVFFTHRRISPLP